MEAVAQGMYICLLHHHFSMTNKKNIVEQHYPYAKTIVTRMMNALADDSGLMKGMSLYPDFPMAMLETGNDISLFNNSLAYCSLRAMEFLAGVCHDDETVKMLSEFNAKMRDNFDKILFDKELGAYINSVDSATYERRPCVNIGSLMWENDFLEEIVRVNDHEYVKFIEDHCIGRSYFRAIPLWDKSFDGDANQLHCTWPVVEENVMRLLNRTGKTEVIDRWAGWVKYWIDKLIVPEGISYLIETDAPETDSWNCEPGTWQAYTMRQWYQDVLHTYLGITLDYGGITISPSGCGAYTLENLSYLGGLVNIECVGSGRYVSAIEVNNQSIKGTSKIPFDLLWHKEIESTIELSKLEPPSTLPLEARDLPLKVKIRLQDTQPSFELLKCYGARITDYTSSDDAMNFYLEGSGYCEIIFRTAGQDVRLIDVAGDEQFNHLAKSPASKGRVGDGLNSLTKVKLDNGCTMFSTNLTKVKLGNGCTMFSTNLTKGEKVKMNISVRDDSH